MACVGQKITFGLCGLLRSIPGPDQFHFQTFLPGNVVGQKEKTLLSGDIQREKG